MKAHAHLLFALLTAAIVSAAAPAAAQTNLRIGLA